MRNVKYGWRCTDPDCAQYMRRNGDLFEMIQVVEPNDSDTFFALRDGAWFSDYTEEEQADAVAAYDYTLDELYRDLGKEKAEALIMECILEESIVYSECIIAQANSFEAVEQIVKMMVEKEGVEK